MSRLAGHSHLAAAWRHRRYSGHLPDPFGRRAATLFKVKIHPFQSFLAATARRDGMFTGRAGRIFGRLQSRLRPEAPAFSGEAVTLARLSCLNFNACI